MTLTKLLLSAAPASSRRDDERPGASSSRGQFRRPSSCLHFSPGGRRKGPSRETPASCHGANVDDGEFAPPLRCASFIGKYAGKPGAGFTYVSTKTPSANPGSVGGAVYVVIIAYILQQNGLPHRQHRVRLQCGRRWSSITVPGAPGRGGRGRCRRWSVNKGAKLPPARKKANPLDKHPLR